MKLFSSLSTDEFNQFLISKCQKWPFYECFDLNELNGVAGIYMLALDEYKQVYIGQSNDIRRRIRSHWNKRKSLERLIFGQVWNSVLSIDSFGALDTTRIFCIPADETVSTDMIFHAEQILVADFDPLYTLNRTEGGIGANDTDTAAFALVAVAANRRQKDFFPFLSIHELKTVLPDWQFEEYLHRFPDFSAWVAAQQQ